MRAHDLRVTLRAILNTLPGGTSLCLLASEAWDLVLITTSSDEAVSALGERLELGQVEITRTVDGWWLRASAEWDQGSFRVVVTGPHHMSSPPRDEDASSRSQ